MVAPLGFDGGSFSEAHGVPDVYAGGRYPGRAAPTIRSGKSNASRYATRPPRSCPNAIIGVVGERERVNEVDDILSPFTLRMSEGSCPLGGSVWS